MTTTGTRRSASPDVLLPQELKDHIVSHLSSDRSALLACCLAHRTLRATAQLHLFKVIYILRASVAQSLSWALDTSPYLRAYVHKLVIAEEDYDTADDPASVVWIGQAYDDLASIVSALPHLHALALRVMDIYDYSSLRTTRHILNYVAPVALGLSRLQAVPAELFAGVRALRLNDVSIDIMAGPCICAPVALELCNIYEDDFAALLLDARRLTHLRLEGMPDEASELVVRGAATLQALEVDEGVIVPQMPLPALRVLALRDLQNLRAWLGAAPGVRHLFVCIPSEQTQVAVTQGTGNLVIWDTDMMIETVFDADTIAKGRALEVVTMVEYFGQGSDGSERRWHDVVGSYRYGERDVEFRHMRIPMPTELDSLFPSSLIDPDILDGKWA